MGKLVDSLVSQTRYDCFQLAHLTKTWLACTKQIFYLSLKLIIFFAQGEYNRMPEEERGHGTISNKTYFTYLREGGNTVLTVLLIGAFITSEVIATCTITMLSHFCLFSFVQGSIITTNWWLSKWY